MPNIYLGTEITLCAKNDIKDVCIWTDKTPSTLRLKYKICSMKKFEKQAKEIANNFNKSKKERNRVNKIIKLLKTNPPYPIFIASKFIEMKDYVLEGRHRLAAYYILGLKEFPAYYIVDFHA